MKLNIAIASVAAAVLLSLGAAADDKTTNLNELVVSAPVKTQVELLPLNVTVVGDSVINNSTESSLLPVLTDRIPGLFVSERGFAGYGVSGGAAGTVNIRGVGQGNKVLFMIDGQPQWASIFGHALPDTYVANGVERVEVIKGPSSLLYGSNAMAGSVNIVTRHQNKEGFYGRARAMFGSFNTQKFALSTGWRKGKLGVVLGGQGDRSNGNRKGSSFWLANEYINVTFDASKEWSAGATVDLTQTRANNPGTTQDPLESMWTYMFRGAASLYARNNYSWMEGGLQAYYNWGNHDVDDGHAPGAAPRDYLFHSNDYNIGVTLYETLHPWRDNDLSVGVDYVHWGGHVWNTAKADDKRTDIIDRSENEVAWYVMMQQDLFHYYLTLNAGVRQQHSGQYGNEWIPQAGFIFRPYRGGRLKFNFSKGFRAPNLRELYMYRPANPDLRPERMFNYEVEYRQTLLGGRLDMGVAFYFIDASDMIQTVVHEGVSRNENTGSFINKGFELDAAWRICKIVSISANYAYLHTSSDNLLYAPKNKLDEQLDITPGNWAITLSNNNVWSLNTGNPDGKENYSMLNLRAAYTFRKPGVKVTPFIKCDNITNKHYEIVYGCPMPGITIMGGVEASF